MPRRRPWSPVPFDTGRDFEPMKGKLLAATAEQEDGKVFWDETNAWSRPARDALHRHQRRTCTYVHPVPGRSDQELGQGDERRLESEFAYDRYGNQTTNADYGIVDDGDRSAFDDETHHHHRIRHQHQRLDSAASRPPGNQDEHGTVISRAESFYDDETFSGNNLGGHHRQPDHEAGVDRAGEARVRPVGADQIRHLRQPRHPPGSAGVPGGAVDFTKGHFGQLELRPPFHAYPINETIHVGEGKIPSVSSRYDEGFGGDQLDGLQRQPNPTATTLCPPDQHR